MRHPVGSALHIATENWALRGRHELDLETGRLPDRGLRGHRSRAASRQCQSHTTPTVMRGAPDCRSRKNTDAACRFPQPSQSTSMIFPCSALGSIVVWCLRLQSGHVQLMSCGRRTATLDFGRDQAAMRSLYRVRRLLNSLHPRLARNPRSEDRRSLPKSRAARDRSRRLGARELQRRPSATRTR